MEVLKVTTVEEVVSILLPQTPEKARETSLRWSFYKRPPRMSSWFLWDFIEEEEALVVPGTLSVMVFSSLSFREGRGSWRSVPRLSKDREGGDNPPQPCIAIALQVTMLCFDLFYFCAWWGWFELGGTGHAYLWCLLLFFGCPSPVLLSLPLRLLSVGFALLLPVFRWVLGAPAAAFKGWDNLPRTLLIYYTNFISSPEGYFHTVICNVPEFAQTAVSHDLHYIAWDNPPKQHPHILTINDTNEMIANGAAFARKFKHDDPVLDKIDKDLLCRKNGSFTPG
ncbi:hypothetical protein DKX38_013876 [Salix brachista]|uniref:Uncharacterized protein n=1 Tax=Salix brachista TaxID=2182728 RepID=A0A5N5LE98_9ROSI|nr:hypothetical protein DKX38_013876 [Salix brachista]